MNISGRKPLKEQSMCTDVLLLIQYSFRYVQVCMMYVPIYTCTQYVFKYTHTHTFVYLYIYIHTHLYIYIHIYTLIYIYMFVYMYINVYMCIYKCIYIYICRCIGMYINVYKYICIHVHTININLVSKAKFLVFIYSIISIDVKYIYHLSLIY